MDVTREEEEEEEEENRSDPLAMSMREFLLRYSQQVGGEVTMLLLRPLLTALVDLGFTFDEFLPSAERPEQRVLSTMAYLQIASDESAEILPMNLQEFNRLVTAVVREQYGAFATSYRPRELSLDRVRSMVGRVVQDPIGILRGEPHAETRLPASPIAGPSATSAPPLLQSQGSGVAIEVFKGLVAAAAASAAAKFAVPSAPAPQPEPERAPEPVPSSAAPSVTQSQSESSFSGAPTGEQSERTESEFASGFHDDPGNFDPTDYNELLDQVATPVLGEPPIVSRKPPGSFAEAKAVAQP